MTVLNASPSMTLRTKVNSLFTIQNYRMIRINLVIVLSRLLTTDVKFGPKFGQIGTRYGFTKYRD